MRIGLSIASPHRDTMNATQISKIVSVMDSAKGSDALTIGLLLLIATLQEPAAYPGKKARPTLAFRDLAHWGLLAFKPLSERFASGGTVPIPPEYTARRVLGDDGKFTISIESLFPAVTPDAAYSYDFDVCLSFAGEQRALAETIATSLRDTFHLRVFYDDFEKNTLWGNDLYQHLYEIYSKRSKYCIVLFSKAYLTKNWTTHELRAAQSRILKERTPYVLPIVAEHGVELPPDFSTVAYKAQETLDISDLCQEVNDRVWSLKKKHWLMEDEMAEVLSESFKFEMFFSPFREYMQGTGSIDSRLAAYILGLIWCCNQDAAAKSITSLLEYMLFSFEPIASLFNEDDLYIAIPPNGAVRRAVGRQGGSLLMQQEFWAPVIAEWKANYPQMFGDEESGE